jgi:hypothetical protein
MEPDSWKPYYGCRSEYGPLELRLQATTASNEFKVFVEDARPEHPCVHEYDVQNSLESAKEYAALRADEYLRSHHEATGHKAEWRCS